MESIESLSIPSCVIDIDRASGTSWNDEPVRVKIPTRGRSGTSSVSPELSITKVGEQAARSNPRQRYGELPIGTSHPPDPNPEENTSHDFTCMHPPAGGSPGTRGRPVKLHTNHLLVHYTPNTIYDYHTSITPNIHIRPVRHRIYQLAEQTAAWQEAGMVGTVAHDGASRLLSSVRLPYVLKIPVSYQEEETLMSRRNPKDFVLNITFVGVLDANTLTGYIQGELQNVNIFPVVSALNLVRLAAHGTTGVGFVGKNLFFFALHAGIDLGEGLEARKGFVMSLMPTRGHLTIKVNVSTTAFYSPGNLATSMLAFPSLRSVYGNRFVRQVKVQTTHIQTRREVVRGFLAENSNTRTVNTADFGSVTISHYLTLKYGIQLNFPHLPLVETRSGKVLPPEFCEIFPGQPFRGALCDVHSVAMSGVAHVYPNVRGQAIRQLMQQSVSPVLSSFGMNIGTDLLQVTGRVLPKPAILYSSSTTYVDHPCTEWNLGEAHFIVGGCLDQWTILVIRENFSHEFAGVTDPRLELQEAVMAFRDVCNSHGMIVTGSPTYTAIQLPSRSPADPIREAAATAVKNVLRDKRKPQLIMVVLANEGKVVYDDIKYLCDVLLDLPSICVLSSRFLHGRGTPSRAQYLSNLSLKLNMKLGGINHRLDAETVAWLNVKPTMVVGMDIAHPRPSSVIGTPSIAAVVASVDEHFAQYPASLLLQESSVEMILNLKTMMIERLKLYQKRNGGGLPERILIYRKGISDSKISRLLSIEVPAMKEAFQMFDTPSTLYRPKIMTVICCRSRRTGTWFGVDGEADGNPEAGTVVDSDVTSPYKFEFFLQAHGVTRGTARPTLYTVVYDEIGVTADEIQGATHALCYMYAPATHAVSLVAPAYYADLACKRGQCYLRSHFSGHVKDEQAVSEDAKHIGDIPGPTVRNTMFYI